MCLRFVYSLHRNLRPTMHQTNVPRARDNRNARSTCAQRSRHANHSTKRGTKHIKPRTVEASSRTWLQARNPIEKIIKPEPSYHTHTHDPSTSHVDHIKLVSKHMAMVQGASNQSNASEHTRETPASNILFFHREMMCKLAVRWHGLATSPSIHLNGQMHGRALQEGELCHERTA